MHSGRPPNGSYPYDNNRHGPNNVSNRGVNEQGNRYVTRRFEANSDAQSYRYNNSYVASLLQPSFEWRALANSCPRNGSCYDYNPDGSSYYNGGRENAIYTTPQGREVRCRQPSIGAGVPDFHHNSPSLPPSPLHSLSRNDIDGERDTVDVPRDGFDEALSRFQDLSFSPSPTQTRQTRQTYSRPFPSWLESRPTASP